MTLIVPDTLEFDFMLGAVPSAPYPLLPRIAHRARALLAARTPEQVESASYTLDWLLETVYRQRVPQEPASGEESEELSHGALVDIEQEPPAGGPATSSSPLRRRFGEAPIAPADDDLGFPPAKHFSKLDTLIDYYDIWEEFIADDLSEPLPTEVYAVLALILVQESLTWLHRLRLSSSHLPTPLSLPTATAMALSGEAAIEAMAAVCQAELFYISATMSDFPVEDLDKTREAFAQSEIERQNEAREFRAQHFQRMNDVRHRENREGKKKAIDLWVQNTARWSSVAKAAIEIADQLAQQGYKFVPSTVQNWLYGYADEANIKLR